MPGGIIFYTVSFKVVPETASPLWHNDADESVLVRKLRASFNDASFKHADPGALDNAGDFWDRLETFGSFLPELIRDSIKQSTNTSPIVVLCYGVAGLMAPKYIKCKQLLERTACFVFFGTPINVTHKKFVQAIHQCAFLECGEKMTEDITSRCRDIWKDFPDTMKPMISVYETNKRRHRLFRSSKSIMNKDLASFTSARFQNTHYFCSKTEHCQISEMNFDEVVDTIQSIVNIHQHEQEQLRRASVSNWHAGDSSRAVLSAPSAPPRLLSIQKHKFRSYPNDDFVERPAISKLIRKYLVDPASDIAGPRTFTLYGLPGMGKTQLAKNFVDDVKDNFPFIFWVDATTSESILAAYAAYAADLKIVKAQTDTTTAATELGDWFERCSTPFLVILDGVKDSSIAAALWPRGDNAVILITTNEKEFVEGERRMSGTSVGGLEDDEAVSMILQQVNPQNKINDDVANEIEARTIVRKVQGMAFALHLVVVIINLSQLTLSEFNKRYPNDKDVFAPIKNHKLKSYHGAYDKTVLDSFGDLCQQLGQEPRYFLNMLSLLHSSAIPESLFSENLSPKLREEPFLRTYEEYRFGPILNILKYDNNSKTFELHCLMSHVIQEGMTAEDQHRAFSVVTALLLNALDLKDQLGPTRGAIHRETHARYNVHIDSINEFYKEEWIQGENKHIIPPTYIGLLAICSRLWNLCGFFKIGLELIKTADAIFDDLEHKRISFHPVPEEIETFETRVTVAHTHACIATEIGDFDLSLQKFLKEKDIVDEAAGKQLNLRGMHKRLSAIDGGIANSYQGLGDHEEAIRYYKKCLQRMEREEKYRSVYAVNICRSLLALKKVDDAAHRLEELVKHREGAVAKGGNKDVRCEPASRTVDHQAQDLVKYREDDVDENGYKDFIVGHQMSVLGNVRIQQKLYDEAFELHSAALENLKVTRGKWHHKTGDASHRMGWHYKRRKQWVESEKAFREALKVYRAATLDGDDIFPYGEIARSSYHLSGVLREMGKTHEASEAMEEAVCLQKKVSMAMAERHRRNGRQVPTEEAGCAHGPTEDDFEKLVSLWAR